MIDKRDQDGRRQGGLSKLQGVLMPQDNKRSFMKGAAILSASTLIVKLLGLLFSIPLANFVAPEGMSHFYIAYNIFGLFLMLSTAGLPVAVSRMVVRPGAPP